MSRRSRRRKIHRRTLLNISFAMKSSNEFELILINISGYDRPGVTTALTSILAKYNAGILDIGQADIHHYMSLGILFKTDSSVSGDIMKELLFKASELNMQIHFTPVSVEEYTDWVGRQGNNVGLSLLLGATSHQVTLRWCQTSFCNKT